MVGSRASSHVICGKATNEFPNRCKRKGPFCVVPVRPYLSPSGPSAGSIASSTARVLSAVLFERRDHAPPPQAARACGRHPPTKECPFPDLAASRSSPAAPKHGDPCAVRLGRLVRRQPREQRGVVASGLRCRLVLGQPPASARPGPPGGEVGARGRSRLARAQGARLVSWRAPLRTASVVVLQAHAAACAAALLWHLAPHLLCDDRRRREAGGGRWLGRAGGARPWPRL